MTRRFLMGTIAALVGSAGARAASRSPDATLIDRIDHFVLTVGSLEATCAFYERVLGFVRHDTPGKPTALVFGRQKINIHQVDHTFEPKARHPTPGAGDFCLITRRSPAFWVERLKTLDVAIEQGPIARIGAAGAMTSIYFRDPDDNLVEVSHYNQGERP